MKVLITSGGTKIKIDSVRDITNMSSGTFGSKIATQFLELGHQVVFLHAKNSKTPFKLELDLLKDNNALQKVMYKQRDFEKYQSLYQEHTFQYYSDYAQNLWNLIESQKPDIVILVAAVSDYDVKNSVNGKIRSSSDMNIELTILPKLISQIKLKHPEVFLVGFKLLVDSTEDQLKTEILKSIENNKCDLVVGNDLTDLKNGKHKLLVASNSNIQKFENDNIDKKLVGFIADKVNWRKYHG
jgi:phosphopantothenate--cysteine ligase